MTKEMERKRQIIKDKVKKSFIMEGCSDSYAELMAELGDMGADLILILNQEMIEKESEKFPNALKWLKEIKEEK